VRNPKELAGMEAAWDHFVTAFQEPLEQAGLLDRIGLDLGKRIKVCAQCTSNRVSPDPTDAYCTFVHGDYKAMNVFLLRDDIKDNSSNNAQAVLVDYASTGIGLGMGDVAMHIHRAVCPQDLANGGEEPLVNFFWMNSTNALKRRGNPATTRMWPGGTIGNLSWIMDALFWNVFGRRQHLRPWKRERKAEIRRSLIETVPQPWPTSIV